MLTIPSGPRKSYEIIRRILLGIAVFQILSTAIGFIELLIVPEWFAPMLEGTAFADQNVLAAILLGVVVGGFQWSAVYIHVKATQWLPLEHAAAGLVMIGWIAGECLVIDSFTWPHALWGGAGVFQLLLVLSLLGVFRPYRQPHERSTPTRSR